MYSSRAHRSNISVWPGFVDALASILLVFIFMLMIFVIGQFYLTEILVGRDRALDQLNQEIDALAQTLSLERSKVAERQQRIDQLQLELTRVRNERGRLDQALAEMTRVAETRADELADREQQLEKNRQQLAADRETLKLKLARIASLQADLNALRQMRDKLESQIAALIQVRDKQQRQLAEADRQHQTDQQTLNANRQQMDRLGAQLEEAVRRNQQLATKLETESRLLEESRQTAQAGSQKIAGLTEKIAALTLIRDQLREEISRLGQAQQQDRATMAALRDRTKALEAKLDEAAEQTRLAQQTIDKRDIRIQELVRQIEELDQGLAEEQQLSARASARVARLRAEIRTLNQQLASISSALALSEQKVGEQKVELDKLARRLNLKLLDKVQELNRYRSEFFGRLREVLGERPEIRIVGDRFLFQSELLFASGSAQIGADGQQQLKQLAATLKEIAARIPEDLDWILRIDGHTDRRPIQTDRFASNWELSTARALSIVHFLIAEGIPPRRLAATGFGEFHPIDPGDDERAYARNRRIEIKFTGQ